MERTLFDTSVLSRYLDAIRRSTPSTLSRRVDEYLEEHERLTFSVITKFEIRRGLLSLKAEAQLREFDRLCRLSVVLPLDPAAGELLSVWPEAERLWVEVRQVGREVKNKDADLLIAATAKTYGCVVAHADADFAAFDGLVALQNWLLE